MLYKDVRIVFVEVPAPWLVRQRAQVPLGPLYLAAVLEGNGYDVSFERLEQPSEVCKLGDYDIIAFSGTTLEYSMVEMCAKLSRDVYPSKHILYGGPHASVMYNELRNSTLFDSICIGEGEMVIQQMVNDAINNKLQKLYRHSDYIDNLDTIPLPARHLIQGTHGGDIFINNNNYHGSGNENVITSRGCPWNCHFCASRCMWSRKVRYRTVDNLILELHDIINKYGIRQIRFADDNLTANKKRLYEFCDKVKDLGIVWRCSARADELTHEACEKMSKAGCREISVGIESGDQRVLDFLNKNTTVAKMRQGCLSVQGTDIKIRALMMIGTPGERLDTPEINQEFLESLNYHMATLSTFVPLPGSAIWNQPEAFHCQILTKDFAKYNKDFWIAYGGAKHIRPYEPLVHNKYLTIDEQIDNVKRMEGYLLATGKFNQG